MTEPDPHWDRADALGDSMRKYLAIVHTVAIVALLSTAHSLMETHHLYPSWAAAPMVWFYFGLGSAGASHFFAKYRAVKRAQYHDRERKFNFFVHGTVWELGSSIAFLIGSYLAIRILLFPHF
jgi:hypothetical protein